MKRLRGSNWKIALLSSSVLVGSLAATTAAFAQVSPTPSTPPIPSTPSTEPAESMSEIIVTAAPNASGIKKLDAAFSVVTLSLEQIKEAGLTAPQDLLKQSPGVYVESSGSSGAGAQVEIAGFPSFSLSPYVTMQLNGSSLFPQAGANFLEGPSLLRPDDTLQRVELVQGGGPGVLYGDGQVGLTANYILKRGSDTPTGSLGFTYGSEGAERIDLFLAGPINKDAGLYASFGGYWNTSRGIRNPQFTADQGGQLTATVSKEWARGSLLIYGRLEKFNDQFVTDTPFNYGGNGNWTAYPGFNPLTGTESSKADQYLNLPVGPCAGTGCTTPSTIGLNQEDGRGDELFTVGGEFKWNFGHGVQVQDDFNVTQGVAYMAALYSSPVAPESLQAFITAKTPASITGVTSINANLTNDGTVVPLNSSVLEAETRYLKLHFHSISNEARVSWEAFPGNTITVGNHTAFYGINELYYTGADILLQTQNNPAPIAVNLTNSAGTYQLTSSQGFVNGPAAANGWTGNGVNTAFYLSDTWKFGKFLFDAGIREERQAFHENVQNSISGKYTADPFLLWAAGKSLVAGSTLYDYNRTATSWTAGLNYEITPSMSAYVRINHGAHFLSFSDLPTLPLNNPGPNQRAENNEAGFKYRNDFIYADLTAFYRTFENVPVQITSVANPLPGNPTNTGNAVLVYGSRTYGFEYQITLTPFHGVKALRGFSLSADGAYSHGVYKDTNGCVSINGGPQTCNPLNNFAGYLLERQPIFQTRLTPAYAVDTSWGHLRFWTIFEYIGVHYGDQLERQPLGTYVDVAGGVTGTVGRHLELTLTGTNLTNSIGISESNPRGALFGQLAPNVDLGRSIDGREVSLQIKYKF